MHSPSRHRAIFLALAVALTVLALPAAGIAAASSGADASEGSSSGGDTDDGSVFCDPNTLPEGEICSLTPDKEEDESNAPAPATETGSERVSVSTGDPGQSEVAGETAGGVRATGTGDVGSVALARTGFAAWIPAVLGACLLMGGVGLLAEPRIGRLHR